ncbi:MAG: Pyruvate/ketoisovalerate oxidoreductase, gamma subunit, partial [Candidatus Gottesmanbacteria bacterium GW2011_GWA1_34_13]
GDEDTHSQEKNIDVLFALNQETIDKHKNELKSGGIIVYDPDLMKVDPQEFTSKKIILYPAPLAKIVKDNNLLKVMENNVALGITAGIFGMDINILNSRQPN